MQKQPKYRDLQLLSGKILHVAEIPGTASWNFWDFYAGGQWETTTIEEADKLLQPNDLMFDIGAWVGPLTLWEADRAVAVVAVEPDAEAFQALQYNVGMNGLGWLVKMENMAISNHVGMVKLGLQEIGGDSQSSITRADMPRFASVRSNTLGWLLKKHGTPKVIKMDIEGGESLVIPEYGRTLRQLGIPLLLALHPNWYEPGTSKAMEEELSHWEIKDLYNSMYLCQPRDAESV